jgi:hypothetical protein
MKKIILSLFLVVFLSSCTNLFNLLPSAWDSNQSAVITDIQQQSKRINCGWKINEVKDHLEYLDEKTEWLIIYSETKKTTDIFNMAQVYNTTLQDFYKRVETKSMSNSYCENKKAILIEQSNIIAKALQGRN